MATRLYPMTNNTNVLEILACVPKGTANNRQVVVNSKEDVTDQLILQVALAQKAEWRERMSEAEISKTYWGRWTAQELYRDMRSDMRKDFHYFQYLVDHYLNPVWKKYDSFCMFGWGRLQASEHVELNKLHSGCDHTTDLKMVEEILYQQMLYSNNMDHCYFDRNSWLGTRDNCKLVTPAGSVYLSELQGLCWN